MWAEGISIAVAGITGPMVARIRGARYSGGIAGYVAGSIGGGGGGGGPSLKLNANRRFGDSR